MSSLYRAVTTKVDEVFCCTVCHKSTCEDIYETTTTTTTTTAHVNTRGKLCVNVIYLNLHIQVYGCTWYWNCSSESSIGYHTPLGPAYCYNKPRLRKGNFFFVRPTKTKHYYIFWFFFVTERERCRENRNLHTHTCSSSLSLCVSRKRKSLFICVLCVTPI